MRMWMVDLGIMCRRHLLGEHVETHMLLSTLRKGISLKGYIRNNCIEPKAIKMRHDLLAKEMIGRGYNHNSAMDLKDDEPEVFIDAIIDKEASLNLLLNRCKECRSNYLRKSKA